MAECVRCGAKTVLFIGEVPICDACDASNLEQFGCPEKRVLLIEYNTCAQNHSALTKRMVDAKNSTTQDQYRELLAKVGEASTSCQLAHIKLLAHITRHGC